MALSSGLAGSFGVKAETTFGTYAAPDRFYRVTKASANYRKSVAEAEVLAAGALGMPGGYRKVTQAWGDGSVELPVPQTKFGLLLAHLTGTAGNAVVQGATAAYLQTYPFADNYGLGLTTQVGVPNRAGTVVPHTGTGGKILAAEFSCGVGELLTAAIDFDFVAASNTGQTLAAPSYTAQTPFHFKQMGVKLGTFGAETAVNGIKKVSVKFERPMDVEAFYANASGTKAQQVTNGFLNITGTLDADYTSTTLEDAFQNDTSFSLVWEFVAETAIASTYFPTIRFTIPGVYFDSDPQGLDGAGVQATSYGFSWRDNGTNLPTITYLSTDTAA